MAKKKNGNGKSNGHSNGNGVASRNKSLLGHNAIFTPEVMDDIHICLLYTSPSPRDISGSRMPSSA